MAEFLRNCWYVAAESGELAQTPVGRLLLKHREEIQQGLADWLDKGGNTTE